MYIILQAIDGSTIYCECIPLLFYFIEICDLANYADDNTQDHIAITIEIFLNVLQKETTNDIKWLEYNYMQANPTKYEFIL